MEKLEFGTKIGNISETEQVKQNIVSIECLYKVAYNILFGTEIDDPE